MKHSNWMAGTFAAALVTSLAVGGAQASTPSKAKVTQKQAEAAATAKLHGRAVASKYEFEDGHWQYAVTVKTANGNLYEAEVSATTGKITATELTNAAEEASEEAADKKAAKRAH